MAAPLRIAFLASSLVSAYWNGAATYYRGMVRVRAYHTYAHRARQFQEIFSAGKRGEGYMGVAT